MNSTKIFGLALELESPWKIDEIAFEEEAGKRILRIWIGYDAGHFVDESGKGKIHDTRDRTWRHLDFFQHRCYLHCKVPRVREKDTNKVKQVEVPWARAGSGFTLLFESYCMLLIEQEMPVNKAAKVVGEYPNRLWTIFNYWISNAYTEADHSEINQLGIDETSSKKGHKYVTVGVDLETRAVVHATEGKGTESIKSIADYLEDKGTSRSNIKSVCIDLSPAFISGVMQEFEQAQIIFDRYHVKALLNKAMDEVRKKEARSHGLLKGHKYLFLKSNKNLSARQKHERNELIELLPDIGRAYRLKELFDDFWDMQDTEEAEGFLAYWCDQVEEAKIQPMIQFACTLKTHWYGILNYLKSRLSNGILEGINSKIQLAKRRARGYRNTQNFINMIYFIAAKLKFNHPHYST